MQPVVQPRASNGYGRRKSERDVATKFDSKFQAGKTNSSRFTTAGKGGGFESSSRDRLIYLTTCLIGHQVEVQVLDGSVFSGICHATNADKDFGIILKMAHLIKDGSRGQNNIFDSVNKTPSRTLIISAKELVQVIAKGVPVTRDGLTTELQHDEQQELMTDSCISQSRHVELGRELEPWVPDSDDPGCPDLENTFNGPWNRGWDQFEANETLFGVTSTFNEELYTTKLDRGPRMRELEREAKRIAREIESEETHDLHLAEERGIQLSGNLEIDEETRFSSVYRGIDDSGYDEIEDILLDSRNDETFGDVSGSVTGKPFTDLGTGKINCDAQMSSRSSLMDEVQSSQTSTSRELCYSGLEDNARLLSTELLPKNSSAIDASRLQDDQSTERTDSICSKENILKPTLPDQTEVSKAEDMQSSLGHKKESSDKGGLSPNATAYDPSRAPSKGQESSPNELAQGAVPSKTQGTVTSHARPSSSASSTSDRGGATSTAGRGLSPSSSVGSLSSEKSTLNPYAKEFKLNPNAKSFIPSQTPLRPASPAAADGSFYYPANMAAVPQMHGMPVGIGIGPSYTAQQPIMFNPQATQMPQPYFHPNGPQYGQQMIIGQPRQVVYMPTYPPEMQYKGRDF
ncbi:Polyadenylate-binding protein-interacting protein 4 [Abeliophyllum distichum]|uniref:Polyadenylate-binding protein-interacting protein 4 n=1 Tax=Abeliophyllum distichum TaxID=126358 RepID=A0ABD1S091_9LAMI